MKCQKTNNTFILVTGANGFIGQALCSALSKAGFNVRAAVRKINMDISGAHEYVQIGDIDNKTDWEEALNNVDVVIHLASRVHITRDRANDPLAEFRRVNVAGTEHLARMAAKHGVRRLIFLSSVKVNGEYTSKESSGKVERFSERNIPNPQDDYGLSKWEAEQVLHSVSKDTGLEIVILRPALVYGPGVKANFLNLLRLIDLGIPLPFSNLKNVRSFVYLGNLIDAILRCITDSRAVGQTFLISDGEDISSSELIIKIAKAMGRKPVLLPFPDRLLRFLGKVTGRLSEVERLLNSLCVENRKIIETLDWRPQYTLDEGIKITIGSYRSK